MEDLHNKTFLSVVLCTYNDEKYIGEAIQSILSQTYPYFELIIVNDGSTDSTRDIIKSFKDDRIILLDKSNTGLIDSLNVGVSKAKYDWIARMDGDDIAYPDRFAKQVPYINKGYQLIGGSAQYMDMDGNDLFFAKTPTSNASIKRQLYVGISPLIHPSVIVKKNLLQEVGGYDGHIYCAEDKDMWLMLYKRCKMISIPNPVLRYRINPNGISVSKNKIQRLNGLVSFAKFKNKIFRCSTDDEYQELKHLVTSHRLYPLLISLYYKPANSFFARKLIAMRRLYTYYRIGSSVKINK